MKLLSVVGEDISQLVPVLYAYKNKFSYHILLCDASTQIRAEKLAENMLCFSSAFELSWKIDILVIEEESLNSSLLQIQKYTGDFKTCWFNTTDAYPMLTLVAAKLVSDGGGQVMSYDHFENKLYFIDKAQNITSEALAPTTDLESYMMLLGYRIVEKKTRKELLPNKANIMALYEKPSLYKKVRQSLLEEHFGHRDSIDLTFASDILGRLQDMDILDHNKKLIPKMQKVLQGDLFEEYIFWLCEALHPDDIAMGVKIDFDDKNHEPMGQYRIYNEFDILLIHNNRVFTVECKLSKRLEGLDYVYKYDAVIDYFGKTSKAIIVNISSKRKERYLEMKSSSNFQHSTLRRARLSAIHIYHESQVNVAKFQSLVGSFFHIGGEDEVG